MNSNVNRQKNSRISVWMFTWCWCPFELFTILILHRFGQFHFKFYNWFRRCIRFFCSWFVDYVKKMRAKNKNRVSSGLYSYLSWKFMLTEKEQQTKSRNYKTTSKILHFDLVSKHFIFFTCLFDTEAHFFTFQLLFSVHFTSLLLCKFWQ